MARLIRAKKLSAREALAEHLKQIERVNPKVNAIVTLVAGNGCRRRREGRRDAGAWRNPGSASRPARRAQGSAGNAGIRTTFGSTSLQRSHSRGRRYRGRADAARRRDHHRQDQHARIWRGLADIQQSLRRNAQSLRPDQNVRRLFRRRGGRARLRIGPRCQRLRYGRLAPQSRRLLQHGWLPPFHRPRAESEGAFALVHAEQPMDASAARWPISPSR